MQSVVIQAKTKAGIPLSPAIYYGRRAFEIMQTFATDITTVPWGPPEIMWTTL